jgi:hypothetical protein
MTPTAAIPTAAATDEVEEVSQAEFERAVESHLGITIEGLRDQARRGEFVSEQARAAWFVISPLVDAT